MEKNIERIKELLEKADINDTFTLTTKEFREFENFIIKAVEKQLPQIPVMKAMEGFDNEVASHLVCFDCGNGVTNYYVRGGKPEYCQCCGHKLDWNK